MVFSQSLKKITLSLFINKTFATLNYQFNKWELNVGETAFKKKEKTCVKHKL